MEMGGGEMGKKVGKTDKTGVQASAEERARN
jgi:hypothetical protein